MSDPTPDYRQARAELDARLAEQPPPEPAPTFTALTESRPDLAARLAAHVAGCETAAVELAGMSGTSEREAGRG